MIRHFEVWQLRRYLRRLKTEYEQIRRTYGDEADLDYMNERIAETQRKLNRLSRS